MSIIDRIQRQRENVSDALSAVPGISIVLDGRGSRVYFPGETIAGSYWFDDVGADEIQAIEVSILWYTEGKGSTDCGIHQFRRYSVANGDWIDPRRPARFKTSLPRSPLSYQGVLIKLRWAVRVRLFLANGREYAEDLPFWLGNISNVRTLKPVE
ncbi:MAG: hypothetical protein FWE67_13060 [Planctomycetaceae bacterium]|nr:hypothetical protein [Planctomycetaceae bacterium]